MSIYKIDKSVVIEEKSLAHRREELYKLVNEIMDEHDLETLMLTTLTKIAFLDYLLGTDVKENKRLNSMLDVVNRNRNTCYTLSDLYIRL
ncbi:hypothetical protein C2I27_03380 [Priestia megaterium]|uniref:hypothetical protein n=1 Tax=Priestia megaterium TaxID=1404 RepID=UPI000D5098A5|nr:hypothetical protein [Priestia megaterium]PVC74940.1 hypothetical protein C2I27_03380 [Priestia megaterium]